VASTVTAGVTGVARPADTDEFAATARSEVTSDPARRVSDRSVAMTSVRTHLWFGNNAAVEAATFYAEHVPNSAVGRVFTARTDPDNPVAEVVEFTVAGHEAIGLNAGPEFHLNEAFSFYLRVDGQDEVDHYWEILTADGGEPSECGWCKDRFGVSWQVIPRELEELSGDYTTAANQRVCQAMLKMGKIDVAELQAAYDAT
jgi:predicted 3-demethylubiquinone-9 3-methyltransferase (glyoxalase superfamily)